MNGYLNMDKQIIEVINFYDILGCDKIATYDELKKSYQRLALASHPDKTNNDKESEDHFQRIHEAWSVLRDPKSRKEYDATLSCQEHTDYLLYAKIVLSDMEYDSVVDAYSFQCRCGGLYYLQNCETLPPKVIIACDECSFAIQVSIKVL